MVAALAVIVDPRWSGRRRSPTPATAAVAASCEDLLAHGGLDAVCVCVLGHRQRA